MKRIDKIKKLLREEGLSSISLSERDDILFLEKLPLFFK